MKIRRLLIILLVGGSAIPALNGAAGGISRSCATVVLQRGEVLVVGHNLDDNIDTPGLVAVNPRRVTKQNTSWNDLKSVWGRSAVEPRVRWSSRFGSITYNTLGRDFIDGGMNEAGLYVGEMTLRGTVWPQPGSRPAIYHHQWMQYLLDNFATVDEVVAKLAKVTVGGHCQWHFLAADRSGAAAVIEFVDGRAVVAKGAELPVPVLCNRAYAKELELLKAYAGAKDQGRPLTKDCQQDNRFLRAATMLRDYAPSGQGPGPAAVDYMFAILEQLECGNNKWQVVYDVRNLRMYFRTAQAHHVRFVDFSAFDLSGASPIQVLDINRDLEGNVAGDFAPWNDQLNQDFIRQTLAQWDMGFLGNLAFKPLLRSRLLESTREFKVEPASRQP